MSEPTPKKPRIVATADPNAAYLRGDGAAGRYLGFRDSKGRAFRDWAKGKRIPYAMVGNAPCYRKSDLDKAWASEVPKEFKKA